MREEIFKELKKRYAMAHFLATIPQLMEENDVQLEDENGEGLHLLPNYDVRLVTISVRDIDEDDDKAAPVMQVRLRKLGDEDEEKLIVVLQEHGFNTPSNEESLVTIANAMEKIGEALVNKFPDKVLVWNWLGDE